MATPVNSNPSSYEILTEAIAVNNGTRERPASRSPFVTPDASAPRRIEAHTPDRLYFSTYATWDRWHPSLTHYRE